MKKHLFASIALVMFSTPAVFAADPMMPIEDLPAGFNWTGAYVGVQAGYLWADSTGRSATGQQVFDPEGFLGGIYVGYNHQTPNNLRAVSMEL